MIDLYDELRSVTQALEAGGVTYALVGGLAVSIYATPRTTRDVDLLVLPADLPRLANLVGPLGYRDVSVPMTFAQGKLTIRRFTKLAGTEFLALDLLLPNDPMLAEILQRRQLAGSSSAQLWVAPVDGLIALKRLRGSPQDLADIAALTGGH